MYEVLLTMTTESLAVIAKISAHETIPGQAFSTAVFIWSITSNPLTDPRLGCAVFSPVKLEVSSSNSDASHPCYMYQLNYVISINYKQLNFTI